MVSGPCIFGLCQYNPGKWALYLWTLHCAILGSGSFILGLFLCIPGKWALYLWTLPVQSWQAGPVFLGSASAILVRPACMESANVVPIEISVSLFELGQSVPGLCCICVLCKSYFSCWENMFWLCGWAVFCIPKLLWAQIVFSHSVCALCSLADLSRILPCDCKLGWLVLCFSVTNPLLILKL
jgi:hypothetical protein